MTYGDKIRIARAINNHTLKELQAIVGSDSSNIAKYERGVLKCPEKYKQSIDKYISEAFEKIKAI